MGHLEHALGKPSCWIPHYLLPSSPVKLRRVQLKYTRVTSCPFHSIPQIKPSGCILRCNGIPENHEIEIHIPNTSRLPIPLSLGQALWERNPSWKSILSPISRVSYGGCTTEDPGRGIESGQVFQDAMLLRHSTCTVRRWNYFLSPAPQFCHF